ncbi:MAG: PHP domain-containing protein [Gammaproteobacteria bacterium]
MNPARVDLHVHTTASDGALAPADVLERARDGGVDLLAITDHDTFAAYDVLAASPPGPRLVTGIEFSTSWRRIGIHVVGLGVDRHGDAMRAACAHQSAARETRARAIDEYLRRRGIPDTYAGAARLAAGGAIGRPHFAAHLVERGVVAEPEQAYKRYLKRAREAHAVDLWATLGAIVDWIRDAGGVAVLAHPGHYRLTHMRLDELVADFVRTGGGALELVSGHQHPAQTTTLATLARRHGLAVSFGSDFHRVRPGQDGPGVTVEVPRGLRAVWEDW